MNRMKTLNQMLTDNPNLLSFVVVPQAQAEDLDSATLKTAIIRRCGDVAPYYQKAADFSLFGTMWFNTHSFLFAHALEVWNATYNPIENYDRYETESLTGTKETSGTNQDVHGGLDQSTLEKEGHVYDNYSGSDTKTSRDTKAGNEVHSGTDTTTTSGTRDTEEAHSGTDTTTTSGSKSGSDAHTGTDTLTDSVTKENEIAGFNSAAYSDANKETEAGTHATQHGETITKSEQESGSNATAHGHVVTTDEDTTGSEAVLHGHRISTDETITNSDTVSYGQSLDTEYDTTDTTRTTYGKTLSNTSSGSEESENERESHVHGNIGVTTAQQMLDAELNLANKFWIYDYIASAFETDNFITAYDSYYESSAWG